MMATKSKVNPLNTMHTAGIFSDMTIDGPVVGTLVLIVDRAKNLPNRKTIGKQDPYCAARLGKEAKKTTTDIRGGQTPKWDQELRFTVHDSPDYYQLKLSVFNDDKRTDLIGESWIDLRDIILPGGGQNDQWQTLACKGKYAGEIRIEITYYDTRPKPEKPAAKPKPIAAAPDVDASPAPPPQRAPVKRRPLPSSPGTDSAQSPKAAPDHVQTPPRGALPHPPAPSFVSKQSPLQAVEYNPPPPSRGNFQEHYSPAPEEVYGAPGHHRQVPQGHRSMDSVDKFIAHEDDRHYQGEALAQAYEPAPYSHGQLTYEQPPPPMPHRRESTADDDRPPPPPVHRVRNNSGGAETAHRNSLDMQQHKTALPMPMRHDVLRSEAHRLSLPAPPPANPIMASNYPGRPAYRPFESAPDVGKEAYNNEPIQITPPRHHSYDSAYDPNVRAMQPTVEDVPESWTPPNLRPGHTPPQEQQYDDGDYSQVSSPAPLNLGGRGSAASGQRHSPPPVPFQGQYASNDYGMSTSPGSSMVPRDPRMGAGQAHSGSYGGNGDPYMSHPGDMELVRTQGSNTYALPPVPAALVPGVDPAVAQEISTRLQEDRKQERRYTQPAPVPVPTRGRQHSEPPHLYAAHASPHGHYAASPVRSYGGSPAAYVSGGPSTPTGPPLPITYPVGPSTPPGIPPAPSPRDPSPNPNPKPNHTIKRKSVSPAPIPEGRRLSGVPFGPDSYEALNPTVASANDASSSEYTNAYGKIVTSDGREVDPSDHLPMDTWAPEPEPWQPKMKAIEAAPRPAPAGAQPMPPSTRRNVRVTVRPQSMQAPLSYNSTDADSGSPGNAGRTRLQKKVHRVSAAPAPLPRAPSPLGPASAHQRNITPPRALVRASTYDYENHAPAYGSGPLVPYGSSGPPIPAKVPLMSGGLGPAAGMGHNGRGMNDDSWALMEEMSRIDIGSGRARRHGGY